MQKFTRLLLVAGLLMSSSVSNAQSLAIPGGEFQIQGLTSDIRLEAHLEVENSNNNDLFVMINCDRSQMNAAHQTYYCWALCYDTTVCNSPDPLVLAGRSIDVSSFHSYIYPNGVAGASTITYTFFDQNNPSDQASASITFDVLTAGINEVSRGTLSTANPNPANSFANISYSVPVLKNGKLVVHNMLGTVVKEYRLTNAQASVLLSTSELSSGVYVYSLINDGKSVSTKKLVVAHH
ncbi:MAG: T9SS type A sorting domain-containing protein [Bacteroidota bacterium]